MMCGVLCDVCCMVCDVCCDVCCVVYCVVMCDVCCVFQRLDPRDPILTFKQCERHTFSLRRDRDTQYAITVQFHDNGEDRAFTTGVLSKSFGTDERTSKSKVNNGLIIDFKSFCI